VNCRQFRRFSWLERPQDVNPSGELPSRSAAQPTLGHLRRGLARITLEHTAARKRIVFVGHGSIS
jgi:hypothetical protein